MFSIRRYGLFGVFFAVLFSTVFMGSLPVHAVTTVTRSVSTQMIIRPTLTATCPAGSVNLGTYNAAQTTATTQVSCVITQNRRTGVVSITAAPAQNFINLSNGAFTYRVNFATFTTTSGTRTGTFATGVSITNPARGAFTFRFNARPVNPVATNAASGTYTGSHTLTFSLI